MATGFLGQPGGVLAPADVAGAGQDAWARVAGIEPLSTIVGGPGHADDAWSLPYNVDRGGGRIITQDAAPGPLAGPGVGMLDDWRDVFNWQSSPVPWLVIASLGILGLMQFRLMVRAGGRKGPQVSAGLG